MSERDELIAGLRAMARYEHLPGCKRAAAERVIARERE